MKYEKTGGKLEDVEVFKILIAGQKVIDDEGDVFFIKNNKVCYLDKHGIDHLSSINTLSYSYYRVKEVEEVEFTEEQLNGWWKHKVTGFYAKFSCPFNTIAVITIDIVTYNSLSHFLMHWHPVEAKEVIEQMKGVGK